ncbi:hypothetical protein TWF694_006762 [Orbilia ellipsospora]|uniref:Uncharacterized protein n=1 Tax=Orbilia ellipsospora TaxID=2528407 RepID=A0AAV9XLJ8_9PEZI
MSCITTAGILVMSSHQFSTYIFAGFKNSEKSSMAAVTHELDKSLQVSDPSEYQKVWEQYHWWGEPEYSEDFVKVNLPTDEEHTKLSRLYGLRFWIYLHPDRTDSNFRMEWAMAHEFAHILNVSFNRPTAEDHINQGHGPEWLKFAKIIAKQMKLPNLAIYERPFAILIQNYIRRKEKDGTYGFGTAHEQTTDEEYEEVDRKRFRVRDDFIKRWEDGTLDV